MKEYNDYLILGVPTRFFRDWIVSRYLDKILELVKSFKLSLSRIEFKIIEDQKAYEYLDSSPSTLTAKAHRPPYGKDGDYFTKPSVNDVIEKVYSILNEADPKKFPQLF